MSESVDSRLLAWLRTPAAYPHRPESVTLAETHISCVFLAGERVYKLKKPVRFDFLDFSTPALREHACREELRLNRRLAPDTYLDVVPVLRTTEGFRIGSPTAGDASEAVDWLVEMQRLPLDQTLEELLARGAAQPVQLDRLAETLARFHRSLPAEATTAEEYVARCVQHVTGNRRELLSVSHHLPSAIVERIHGCQLQMLRLDAELFARRAAASRIVEGHGDLRPEHVCLVDRPVVFDCVEFSRDFRTLDMADEWAFLVMECDALGARWVGQQLWPAYCRLLDDDPPAKLRAFYQSYRACVRAKVAALRADQLAGEAQAAATAQAQRYLELADGYLRPWQRPVVLAVGGVSGSGKSTLARELAESLGAEPLRTDVIRQELFAGRSGDPAIYHDDARRQVYDALLARAAELAREGVSVVLDGTFELPAAIQDADRQAMESGAIFLAVRCTCPPEVAADRVARRLAKGRDASEARPELVAQQQASWTPWPAEIPQCEIDSQQPLTAQVQETLARLAAAAHPVTG